MPAKRILYLCSDPGIPIGGTKGASIHIREFLSGILRAHAEVTVVAANAQSEFDLARPSPVHILPADRLQPFYRATLPDGTHPRAKRDARDYAMNGWFEQKLSELLEAGSFDLIYERYSLFGVAGQISARRYGIPHILEVNAPLVDEASKHRKLESYDLARSVEHFVFNRADQIVCVSDVLKQHVLRIAPGRDVHVVPNGVNTYRFSDLPDPESKTDDKFVVGFMGAVRPWHGVDRLLNIAPGLIKHEPGASIRIVGELGPLGEELEARSHALGLGDSVTFAGKIAYDHIPAELAAMDVALAPYPDLSEFYFSPLKVFEYMAAGRAIIASAIGQIPDILKHEETALLVPAGDDQSLLNAILRLKKDPALRRRLGCSARREACSKHSWDARIKDILTVVSEPRSTVESTRVGTR